MVDGKRLIVAVLSGLLFGFVCLGFASGGGGLPAPVAWQIVASRTLIGLAIGISRLDRIPWAVHGLLMGMLFSVPLAIGGLMADDIPGFSKAGLLTMTIVFGMIYGLLIELITSVLFKARIGR
jgi:hypothetical protein